MARTKGTPKTGGRQKGTPNKLTQTAKEWIADLIDKNRTQIKRDLKELEPKDRLAMLEKLMAYVVPKATQGVELNANINRHESMTDEELKTEIEELKRKLS